jgi:SAM-dependent methyltransferase
VPRLEGDVNKIRCLSSELVETRWSPYQKIHLVREHYEFKRPSFVPEGRERLVWEDHSAYVNGHWYWRAGTSDLEEATKRAEYANYPPHLASQQLLRLPHWLARGRTRALLLGSGMGRDAAAALAEGWGAIDCVEIEESFVRWGRELHPEKPYANERVRVHVDDARRFLRASPPGHYELIVFCYLDSHALTSNFTNTNLDSYVYTRESLAEAKRALAPSGVLALGFWSPRPFIYRRLESLLGETFGKPPIRLADEGSLFLTGLEDAQVLSARVAKDPRLAMNLRQEDPPGHDLAQVPVTTDDWPFFYLATASVPVLVRVVLGAIALLSAVGIGVAVRKWRRIDLHFLLLGAAFMLVETWAISRASLVYGATWHVSSAVIGSLLVAVLLANAWVERRGPVAFSRAFPLLLATLLVATWIDPSRLLDLPRGGQLALAAPLYALPFLFASAVFATSLLRAERVEDALASNLLGAVLGGSLECLAYATGLRSLGFLAVGLYLLAWVAARRAKNPANTPLASTSSS